jgi:hypothetical protein
MKAHTRDDDRGRPPFDGARAVRRRSRHGSLPRGRRGPYEFAADYFFSSIRMTLPAASQESPIRSGFLLRVASL